MQAASGTTPQNFTNLDLRSKIKKNVKDLQMSSNSI